jgi:hypothetical protein
MPTEVTATSGLLVGLAAMTSGGASEGELQPDKVIAKKLRKQIVTWIRLEIFMRLYPKTQAGQKCGRLEIDAIILRKNMIYLRG